MTPTFVCILLFHYAAASSIISQSTSIVFADDNTTDTLQLSLYGLKNISSVTLGGNITCDPQAPDYSAMGHACLVTHTRNQICQSIAAEYAIPYTYACAINPSRCFNISNGLSSCTAMTQLSDQCSQISCYLPSNNACYLYLYKDTTFLSSAGFAGSPCDGTNVCSDTFTCIPDDPPDLCPWDISCQFSDLHLLHNDLVIAFTDGTNITQKSAITAVDRPTPTTISTPAETRPYGAWFGASAATPITVSYTPPLISLNVTTLLLCNGPTYSFNMTTSLPSISVPAGTLINCGVQVTYGTYGWTVSLQQVTITIEYLPLPVLFSLCPAEILAGIETDVVVQGSLFVNTTLLSCTFGGQRVPILFLSSQTVVCYIFPVNDTTTFIPLTISNDGVSPALTPLQLKITGGCETIKPNSVAAVSQCVCRPGYQDMGGFCQLCADGTYQPNYAQQSCLPCDASEDTAGVTGSLSISSCLCKTGKYRASPSDTFCIACPSGLSCIQNETVSVLPGYWRADSSSIILTECHAGSIQCPGGVGGGSQLCAKGYKGPLCSVCRPGYGLLGTACLPCPSRSLNGFVVFVIVCAGVAVVIMLVKTTTRKVEKGDTMGVTIKITFSYLQLLYYEGKLAANWSHKSNQFFASLIPVTLSPSFLSIQCATEFGFYKNITLMMVLPLIIAVACVVYHLFYWVYKMNTAKHDTFFWWEIWMDCEGAILVLLYMAHPTISQDIIRSFECVGVPGTGTSYMRDDMRVDCNSDSYHRYVVVAALYVVFYIAGFLLFILRRMLINSDAVKSVNHGISIMEANTLIFFVRGYHNNCYLWEFVVIARKLGVVLINALLPVQLQLVWAGVIIAVSLSATVSAKPYCSVIVNRLEIMSLAALAFTILLGFHGLLMVHPKQVAIFTLLVMVNTTVTAVMIIAVFRSMKPLIAKLFERAIEISRTVMYKLAPGKREFHDTAVVMHNRQGRVSVTEMQSPAEVVKQASDGWDEVEL